MLLDTYRAHADTEAGEPPLLKNVVVLSDARSAGAPPITAVAHTLTVREKWIFLATNVAYMVAALFIFWAPEIPTASTACFGGLCASSAFHGSVVAGLACMSTYWHGAQCHLVEWLYCRRADGSAVLHSAAWMKRLMVCDIFCSLSLVVIGTCCFGALRTLSWILRGVPLVAPGEAATAVPGVCIRAWALARPLLGVHRADRAQPEPSGTVARVGLD